MININLNSVKNNIQASDGSKKLAYEKLKAFKEKNEQLKATYFAKGQEKIKIVI